MPSIYTHNYFARDTYKKLEKEKIRHIDNKIYYEIFAQSFDNLFYLLQVILNGYIYYPN